MPKDLRGMPDQEFPGYSGVISNWFWRDNEFNRQDDNLAIKLIQEARALNKSKEEASKRRATWFALVIPPNMMKGFSVARSRTSNGPVDRSFPSLKLDGVQARKVTD